ncbi:LYR motif-containing protein 4 isoform X2 [Papio anubis]|uniref:LYR motif-containing protein 4 isoform X2 n=1 Tax=Papio anubis TaxID=9555 RepID=UPI0012AE696D|nr:LYR motif-containing protein 4 isoform X2 [Papio anubis]
MSLDCFRHIEVQDLELLFFRTYAVRRIRDAFRENKNVKDPVEIQTLVNKAKRDLEVIRRQGTATSFSYQTPLTNWQCHGPCLGRKPIREEMRKEQLSSQSLSPARKAHIHTQVVSSAVIATIFCSWGLIITESCALIAEG